MTRSKEIVNELEQISPVVAQINATVPYQVPEVYFETLSTVVLARIAAGGNEENSILQLAGKTMPQDVPAGYFDALPHSILQKIYADTGNDTAAELQQLSPVLAGISKTNVYQVPAGYFNDVAATVSKRALPQSKTVSLFNSRQWLRYAAAAVVISMMAFGITYTLQQKNNNATVSIKTETQFNTQLASISDDAIIAYLQMNTDTKDAEAIKQLIDGAQLPEETDYIDEEFLEAFMKELEAKQTN